MDYYSSDSESVVSSSTFDDYENSENINFEFRQSNLFNYLADVNSAIQGHDEITIDNGLALNAKYKQLLLDLRTKFEQMLQAVQEKYAANEVLLDQLRNHSMPKNTSTRNASIYICGAPYFKEIDLSPGPNNKDYIYRKNVRKEFFPIDYLSLPKRFWTSKDKVDIVKGVKEQIINHLRAGNSSDISEIRNTQKLSRSTSKKITNMREMAGDLEKKPFPQLYKMVETTNFSIDWSKISFKNLDSRHLPNECMAMWNHYLKPGLNHGLWTEEEEEKLQDAVIRHNYQDWDAIAACTNARSPMQCFVHYRTALSESAQVKKNEKFTPFEDQQLLELVEKYSDGDVISWTKVCQQMPGRNRYQCYHRYMFTIKPGIKRDRFTVEEDCAIIAYVHAHGENFGKMPPNLLPGRTPVQIRNRYNNTLKAVDNKVWTVEEDQKLMEFVEKNGTTKWSEFAKFIGTKTRFACRCRYSTIKKYLERNPNACLQDVPRKDKSRSTMVNLDNYLEAAAELKAARENPAAINFPEKTLKKMYPKAHKSVRDDRLLLDKNGMKLSSQFFLSYNYRFGRIPRPFSLADTKRTFTMLQLMDFELDFDRFQSSFLLLPQETQNNLTLVLNLNTSEQMQDDIRYVKSFGNKFPVNFNSVVAWRAMQILVADRPCAKIDLSQRGREFFFKYNLFLRRFKQIFYWTALLSKIDLKVIKDRIAGKVTKEPETIEIVNEIIGSEDEDEIPVEVEMEEEPTVESEKEEDEESDDENAVDFLLSHIQKQAQEKSLMEANSEDETPLSMPADIDFEETVKVEESQAEKRKNKEIEFKKPKRVAAAKSMPLT
ncbi:snRNA-activating protein complex subunit 4 homolog [Culicoides brevitarsis]|uniref:snRNA-activating protein complex subunit 4 homolog n=1 Tax=Culicoides brevitarsis TaxID=469753 RepID=UPI00307BEF63